MEQNQITKDTDKFPCPSCGGNMHFDPASGMLKCEYCDSTIDFERLEDEIKEYDFSSVEEDEKASENWSEQSMTIQCESCGAQTVISDDTMSKFCAFCGSSHIIKNEEIKGILPESVIPFTITKSQADTIFKKWIKKRWLAPNRLKTDNIKDKFKGTYIPYWTYDTDTQYSYTAQAGDYYYVTESFKDSNGKMSTRQVRKIRWRVVRGSNRKYFDDVQVSATSKVNPKLLKKTEPFKLGKLLAFQPQFLSGFLAERYSVDVKTGWIEAQSIITDELKSIIRASIAADEVRAIVLTVTHNDVKYKHILVPLWLSGYRYAGKTYQVMVNGESGKLAGKFPLSPWKVTFLILGIVAVIAVLYYLFMHFA